MKMISETATLTRMQTKAKSLLAQWDQLYSAAAGEPHIEPTKSINTFTITHPVGKLEEPAATEPPFPQKTFVPTLEPAEETKAVSSVSENDWKTPPVLELGRDYSLADGSKSEEVLKESQRELVTPAVYYESVGEQPPDTPYETPAPQVPPTAEPPKVIYPRIIELAKKGPEEPAEAAEPEAKLPVPEPQPEPHEPSTTTKEQSADLDVMQSLMQQTIPPPSVAEIKPEHGHSHSRERSRSRSRSSSRSREVSPAAAAGPHPKDKRKFEAMPKPTNYKTVPCRLYHSPIGCARGDFCHFIHDPDYAGKELPPELWKNKRKRHDSPAGGYYGGYSPKMMPFPMMPPPYMYGPPPHMSQPPMRMQGFPVPPRGYMPFPPVIPSPHSPEHSSSGHRSGSSRSHGSRK